MSDRGALKRLAGEFRGEGEKLIRQGRQMVTRALFLERAEGEAPEATLADAVSAAREAYSERRRRNQFFRDDLFGEPAWDMLLDLYVNTQTGRRTSVTAACIGSAAPSTTALRYIDLLSREGLIERETDPSDARRSWLTLSPLGLERMTGYLLDRNGAVEGTEIT